MAKKCKNCRNKKRNLDKSPKRPARGSIRKAKRLEMRRQRKKKLIADKTHESSVEFSGGKTISESVMSVVEIDLKPVTEVRETKIVERVLPTMPDVEIVD